MMRLWQDCNNLLMVETKEIVIEMVKKDNLMLMELPKTPIVNVHTTENRGLPEEIAKRCADKIVSGR